MKCIANADAFIKKGSRIYGLNGITEYYGLVLEAAYEVYGLGNYNNSINILLDITEDCRPSWYSLSQFRIVDNAVPTDWKSAFRPSEKWTTIMGYPELISSPTHFDGILERNEKELAIFYRMKSRVL
jgi:hypothetical protein